ncbi:unnamed protein product [Nezara viridula]|uniref:Uncharacterized protein n=1 Tax=Nezara viridula TaxID=85310 RepID=A0A9P0EEI2_NEZVI|nr:unnamed protein product [Nezara viridula]
MSGQGHQQVDIANAVGVSQIVVSRALTRFRKPKVPIGEMLMDLSTLRQQGMTEIFGLLQEATLFIVPDRA